MSMAYLGVILCYDETVQHLLDTGRNINLLINLQLSFEPSVFSFWVTIKLWRSKETLPKKKKDKAGPSCLTSVYFIYPLLDCYSPSHPIWKGS